MPSATDIEIQLLLEAIYQRFHHDFRHYSKASLKRRLSQAMTTFGCGSITELQARVLHDPKGFPELLRYLTVQVSDMFRDPSFYRVLRERIAPILGTYPSLRVWCAGCSEGEEVYSLAILLREEGLLERTTIYATDVNPAALRKAEAGVYPLERVARFAENHRQSGARVALSEHYHAAYDSVIFDRSLIKRAVFADHSLATDNVFAEVQLVTCRNVLIYFDRPLQERAVGLFADALDRRGFLGLGSRESLQFNSQAASFELFDADEKWYRRW